jgi:tRNA-modifying protein YgfZ
VSHGWRNWLVGRGARIVGDLVSAFGDGFENTGSPFGTTITPLLSEGLITATGEDAHAFLQGQLANDVTHVSTSRAQLAAYCTPKGRVLATPLVWLAPAGYQLQLPHAMTESIRKRLQMYVLRSKVTLADASEGNAWIGVAGSQSADVVRSALALSVASPYDVAASSDLAAIALPGDRVQLVMAVERGPELWDRLSRVCAPAGQGAWARQAIVAGVPQVTPATADQFVPQMLNLDLIGALSFEKGCYPGQEIVARSQHLGQVKRRLHRFAVDGSSVGGSAADASVAPGTAVYLGEQPVGTVINAAPAGRGTELLAVVQTDALSTSMTMRGTLSILAPDGPTLRRLSLPYPMPETARARSGS